MSETITVNIVANDAQFQAAMGRAAASSQSFASKMKAAGASMESAGRTLTHGLTVPILAVGAAAVKMAYDYQTALAKTISLSGGFGISQQQLSDKIMGVSKVTGQSATDLANALYPVQSSLHNTSASMDVLTAAGKMSALGMGDASTVADTLVSAMNAYGIQNMSASKAADIFTAVIQNSKFKIDDLAGTIGRLYPIAANAGVSLQGLGGDLASLSHSGLGADQAVTGLSALISNMIQATRGTGNAAKELTALHLSAKGLLQDVQTHGAVSALDEIINKIKASGTGAKYTAAQWKDFAANMGMSLADVKAKFQGLDLGALQKIFPNKKAMMSALGLTDITDQAAQDAGKNVALNYLGGLDKIFSAYSATNIFKIKSAINDLKNGLIELGGKVLPTLSTWIQNIANWWDKLSPATKTSAEHFALVAAEIGPILLVGGKLVSLLGRMSDLLKGNPWTLAIAGLGMLYINCTGFRNAVNDLVGDLKPLFDNVTLVKGAVELLAGAFAGMKLLDMGTAITSTVIPALVGWKNSLYAVRDAEVAAEASTPVGAVAAIAGVAAVASYKLVKGVLDDLSGSAVDNQKKIDGLTTSLKDSIAQIKQVQGPGNVAGDSLKYVTTQAAALVAQLPGVKDKAVELANILIGDFHLSAEQAKQGLEDAGFGAQDAQAAISGINTSGAISAFNNLATAAAGAANTAAQAAYLIQSLPIGGIPTSGYTSAGKPVDVSGIVGGAPTITPHLSSLAGGAGGGGSGGSKGSSSGTAAAAKTAAKAAAKAAALAAAEANAAHLGKPLLDMEAWLVGGEPNTGKDGPITTAAKAMAAEIKKNFTVKGGTVPQAATDAMTALNNLATQASTFNTGFQTNLTKGADFVSVFESTGAGSADIKSYLTQQVAKVQRLGTDLKTLSGRGVPASILQMLANAGVDGVDIADSLVASNAADLSTIIGLGNTLTAASQSIANQTESEIFTNPAALPKSVGAAAPLKPTKDAKGHTITVNVSSNASPKAIAKEIAWQLKTASK